MNYIFGYFDIILWWDTNVREGSSACPIEEGIDHSKFSDWTSKHGCLCLTFKLYP